MAKYNLEEFEQLNQNKKVNGTRRSNVGYLNSLKNDGDEVVVRFACHSLKDIDIVDVHKVQVDGKYRNVECLRNALDPVDTCPLCQSSNKLFTRAFIKLIDYVKTENGTVEAQPKIWETTTTVAKKLKSFFEEYGDLTQYIFKIKRSGIKGSLKVNYDIIPTNPVVYKPELYVADFSDFETLDLTHHSYMVKTFEELDSFVKTGTFPQKQVTEQSGTIQTQPQQSMSTDYEQVVVTNTYVQPNYQPQNQTYTQPTMSNQYTPQYNTITANQQSQEQQTDRPRRIYQY